jgi:hypothetical protein
MAGKKKAIVTVMILTVSISGGDYYFNDRIKINGRQINETFTPNEFIKLKNKMENVLTSDFKSIQDVFSIEDIINYNCPNGFSVGEINGEISVSQIKKLLNGNCKI